MANRVILTGNVGGDPQIRTFDWGKTASFTLATTERGYTTKDGKQIPDSTDWHNISAKGSIVNVIEKYVKKGTKLFVEGKLKNRSYEKDGAKKYVTEVVIESIELLGSKGDGQKVVVPEDRPEQPQPQSKELDDGLPF